jgi:hypothetical protein
MLREKSADRVSSPTDPWIPETEAERRAVREQLDRLLASHLFKNSKRCPRLLKYIVEAALKGRTDHLKERSLGIEVFGREPEYDTNLDPIVRATAGEIRKRIAQYYYELGHEEEIRIDLPSGCYIPEFRLPLNKPVALAEVQQSKKRSLLLILGVSAVVLGASLLLWRKPWVSETALDRFWQPVLDSSGTVLMCVGPSNKSMAALQASSGRIAGIDRIPGDEPTTVVDQFKVESQKVALADSITLANVAGLLASKGKTFHVQRERFTSFADFRGGSVILIGAFNNDWTLRLTRNLRFSFQMDARAGSRWIQDRRDPGKKDWLVNDTTPYERLNQDYAIVSRLFDSTTERMVIIAAGIGQHGTASAGEFLTDPHYMEVIAKQAPKNWDHKNFEAVLATSVISGNSGPPRVVALEFW